MRWQESHFIAKPESTTLTPIALQMPRFACASERPTDAMGPCTCCQAPHTKCSHFTQPFVPFHQGLLLDFLYKLSFHHTEMESTCVLLLGENILASNFEQHARSFLNVSKTNGYRGKKNTLPSRWPPENEITRQLSKASHRRCRPGWRPSHALLLGAHFCA